MIRSPDQFGLRPSVPELGVAAPDGALLRDVARAALGDDSAEVRTVRAEPTGYAFTSIATGGLFRVTGTASTGTGNRAWSSFLKVLQHPRHWELIDLIPPQAAAEIKRLFPWRAELDVREQVLPVLPPGLRVPEIHRLVDLGEDRLAVWMEDIDVDDEPWSDEVYARAAHLLARLAARRTPGTAAGASELAPGVAVRKTVEPMAAVLSGVLADDTVWARHLVADVVDPALRTDLRRALAAMPALLAEMDDLPGSLPHGDAAPANLLRPRGEQEGGPGTFVAVDWSYGCQLPFGHDLGQLLVGEVQDGRMEPDRLPGLFDLLVSAYVDGLHEEGVPVGLDSVRRGAICSSLGPRTTLGAFPFDRTVEPATDEHVAFLRRRAGLARFLVDLVLG